MMYINGIGSILPSVEERNGNKFGVCVEPEYGELINANQLRRMSRLVRMGMWTAKQALLDANIQNPDAIITSSAYGCNEDTEKFIRSLSPDSSTGSPTPFIQSTHNALGGQL